MIDVVGVMFNDCLKIQYYKVNNIDLNIDDYVVVSSDRGLLLGKVATKVISVLPEKLSFEPREVVRIASKDDIKSNDNNIKEEKKAMEYIERFAKELELDMKVLNASFTLDRSQLLFQFVADDRVDFRLLAKKLAGIYKTRIELRQIGVRDKAKMFGGYGQCGKKLCCSTFLNELNSVSINMAKNQNLALNPQKINGVCGRLMCCLTYENDLYDEYKKGMPKIGDKVTVDNQTGEVIDIDLPLGKYTVQFDEGKVVEVSK